MQTSTGRRPPLPFPLMVGGQTDCLPQISRQQGAVESACQTIMLLLVDTRNAAFPGPSFYQRTPHQVCVDISLQEV